MQCCPPSPAGSSTPTTSPPAQAGRVLTVGDRVWFLRSVRGRLVLLDQLEQQILPALRG
ncbi:MAG: hypothetical protein ACRDZO_29190 [Egibacteraceae bacterium]